MTDVKPSQLRAARALLGWSEAKLAQMSRVSLDAVRQLEREQNISADAALRVRRAFEAAGVIFLGVNEVAPGGLGIRLER